MTSQLVHKHEGGHPRLSAIAGSKTWMAGTSPGHDERGFTPIVSAFAISVGFTAPLRRNWHGHCLPTL
jgi:hypothetical protein